MASRPDPNFQRSEAGIGTEWDWAVVQTLAACRDLAFSGSRLTTFELDPAASAGGLTWSPSAADVLGCSPDATERVLRRLLAPLLAAPEVATDSDSDFELEQQITTASGDERFILMQAHARCDAATGRRRLQGAVVDVTLERLAEQELLSLLDRYRLLVELSPDAICVHEAGVIRYANSAAGRLAHSSPSSMVGTSIVPFIDPDELDGVLERISSLTEPGMVSEPTVVKMRTVDGEPFLIESISVRTTWEGRPAFQVIMRDIAEREEAKAALRAQAKLVASVSDAIVATDDEGRITSWNPAAEQIFGWKSSEVVGRHLSALAVPDRFIRRVDELLRLGGRWSGDLWFPRKEGGEVPVHASVATLVDDLNRPGVVAVCSDQSLRLAAAAADERAQARFSTVVATLDEGIAVIGADGLVQSVNPAAERIFGRQTTELMVELSTGAALDPCAEDGEPLGAFAWPITRARATRSSVPEQVIGVHQPGGDLVWLRINVHPLESDDGEPDSFVCSFTDITAQRHNAESLVWAAGHDALTNLPNRWAMDRYIDEALASDGAAVAVLFIDLDRFKDLNDSLGHRVGDIVLCTVADRLRGLVEPPHLLGRLGGDEFLVLSNPVAEAEAVALAERIVLALSRPFDVFLDDGSSMTVSLGASVGVATAGSGMLSRGVGELLQEADAAMYEAKARGRNRVELFDAPLREAARHRLNMREELRLALEHGQLDVHYQPLWHTRPDPHECPLAGFEALVRWHHPTRGLLPPADFIDVAEDTGLITRLGLYVLDRACHQTMAWRRAGHDLYVSVNLSARQLSDPHLIGAVDDALARSRLPARSLWLELTESALAEEGLDAVAVLDELVDRGVRISIDDFGTGYSSLGRLRRYPVAALKVDQSFVADMTPATATDGQGDGGAIVESAISLAHRLGLSVVAEGVETAEQLVGLASLRCDQIQGFLLGRPAGAHEVEQRVLSTTSSLGA